MLDTITYFTLCFIIYRTELAASHEQMVKELRREYETQLKQQQLQLKKVNDQRFIEELQEVREELKQHYEEHLEALKSGYEQGIQVCSEK